jgi:hypothetical protein
MMRITFFNLPFLKKIFFTALFFQGVYSFAQSPTPASPPLSDEKPPKKIADPKDHIVVDFDYDGYTHLPAGIKTKPYSLGGNAYVMWDYPFGYGPLSVAVGIGFSTHDVHTNGRLTYSIDGKYTSFVPITTKYSTNKFSCNYIDVPVELRVRIRGNHKLKFAIGGKIGYAYNVHTKFADADGKIKVYRIKNIDPLRYGVTVRIGYDRFNLQGFYALSELFIKGRGEAKMVPYSIGIGMLFY